MTFSLDSWKKSLVEQMPGWQIRMQQAGVNSIYAFLSAATVLPVVEAMRQGEWAAASALGGVLAGLGSNLLANVIQNWKDEADGARQLEAQVAANDELRAEIDAVLEELRTLDEARIVLPEAERQWFGQTLQQELAKLGNLARFQTTVNIAGDYAGGDVHKSEGGVHLEDSKVDGPVVGRDVDELVMGDKTVINMTTIMAAKSSKDPLKRYLARLIADCNQLDSLAALSFDLEDTTQITLDQVYIDLNTTDTVPLSAEEKKKAEDRFGMREDRPLPVLEATAQSQQVGLVGRSRRREEQFCALFIVAFSRGRIGPR